MLLGRAVESENRKLEQDVCTGDPSKSTLSAILTAYTKGITCKYVLCQKDIIKELNNAD